jgi:hypothetical protein
MDKIYPNFAYMLKVNTSGSQLRFPNCVTTAAPVALRTSQIIFDDYDASTWQPFAPDYEHNMLITATLDYNKKQILAEGSKVAAFVGEECRGMGELVFVPELNQYMVSMFVYSNEGSEPINFRIHDAQSDRYFDNYEVINFQADDVLGRFETPYHFSNVAPDNSFTGSIFPNPFSSKFTVNLKSDKAQSYHIQLLDVAGHTIEVVELEDESNDISQTIRTDAMHLSSGIYIIQVTGSLGETRSFKLVHNAD